MGAIPNPEFDADDWDDFTDDGSARKLISWLEAHGPAEWHGVVESWNWDWGDVIPAWVAYQDDCDGATAQIIYWCSNGVWPFVVEGLPNNPADPANWEDGYKLARFVADRWGAGSFKGRKFYYDYETFVEDYREHREFLSALPDPDAFPYKAPKPFQPNDGALVVDSAFFVEGYPIDLLIRFEPQAAQTYRNYYRKMHAALVDEISRSGRKLAKKLWD